MIILGISAYYHDSAAAILVNGIIIAAAEEERFSRLKHDSRFPVEAINFCLLKAQVYKSDIDYVVFYEKPFRKFERILQTQLGSFPKSWKSFGSAMKEWFGNKLWIKSQIQTYLNINPNNILFIDHHLSHAASSFFVSPFEESAILTLDGVGEWSTSIMGTATADWGKPNQKNKILITEEQVYPHSLGLLYSVFTAFLGFRVNNGEYKVMGLSSYGEALYLDKINKLMSIDDSGNLYLDQSYFSYQYSTDRAFSNKFIELFGEPANHNDRFFDSLMKQRNLSSLKIPTIQKHYADIAASIQQVTEEVIIKKLNYLYDQTKLKSVCLAGGVALNSKANGRILNETPFEKIFIQPAAGDSGGAIGSALYVYHVILGERRKFIQTHSYYGADYDATAIVDNIKKYNLKYQEINNEQKLIEIITSHLLEQHVIGLFQGRAEWGPRALGNRSIIADPRNPQMKDILNLKIKKRENFRPFAPSIMKEEAHKWFELDNTNDSFLTNFMLTVLPIQNDKILNIKSANHFGTSRVQTVNKSSNPRFHSILESFQEATGVPILINTSFNTKGEPIVNTPEQALNMFLKTDMDLLVLENFIVRKLNCHF